MLHETELERKREDAPSLLTIAAEWGRLGCVGFGGPPAHIALLRELCVRRRGWLASREFEDAIAACNLLPGPASTQLAIFCGWRLRGRAGALVGGACFILPGLAVIIALAAVFLAARVPLVIAGLAAGAGAAVPAVAAGAATGLIPASWQRAGETVTARLRWIGYLVAGAAGTLVAGPFLVLVLAACGLAETAARRRPRPEPRPCWLLLAAARAVRVAPAGGLLSLAWVAVKVGALSFGGGFVIIPLMQHDAVQSYHWMTAGQFLSAVALGQVTPGPVVQTVAVVGYAAAGAGGALLAALIAFAPSFLFVLGGGPRFSQLRGNRTVQAFLAGAGPAAIGAIAGAAVTLGLALSRPWQFALLAAALVWVVVLRRGVVSAIAAAALAGACIALAGGPLP
jgi:chromate transporter